MPKIEEVLKTKPIKDPHDRALINIMYTGVWLQNNVTQILKPYGVTEPQYNVLRILRGQQGNAMNLYEIQDRMIQRMSNVSRLIDKLLLKQYVVRAECPGNRRRVDISITQKGLDLLEEITPTFEREFKNLAANLKKEQAKMLGDLLDELHND